MPVVTLTSDFGSADSYVSAMKGVILSINPHVTIVDVTHSVPPQDVFAGAFALMGAAGYFPSGTVHVAVVDPGVGGDRRPIALDTGRQFFVGPDNGVLSLAASGSRIRTRPLEGSHERDLPPKAVHLTNRTYWLPDVSHTFHGRDIFAPVAAHLSNGVPLADFGETIEDFVRLDLPRLVESAGVLVARVIHIDRFGNLITNMSDWRIGETAALRVEVAGTSITGVCRIYADGEPGEVMALIGSGGFLEIAVRDGSAARMLGAKVGDEVRVIR